MPANGPFAFLNYRRSAAGLEGAVLAFLIQQHYGDLVFIDVDGIDAGANWPAVIANRLERATVLIVVIDPKWLFVQDKDGRRKLDISDDWVRREIEVALAREIHVLPVCVSGGEMPNKSALPDSIRALADRQALVIHDPLDPKPLVHALQALGFPNFPQMDYPPRHDVRARILGENDMNAALNELPDWTVIRRTNERGEKGHSFELMRIYKFRSFQDVLHFMNAASRFIARINHHPHWENQYQDLMVRLTTWDVGHRITRKDVDVALYLDRLYVDYAYP